MSEVSATLDLRSLRADPFGLLNAMQLRLNEQMGQRRQSDRWIGLGFRVKEHWYVVPQNEIKEVIQPPDLTRVPGARSWLLGLANVRGSLLPVIDLGKAHGDAHSEITAATRVLIHGSDRNPSGLLVDEVAGFRAFSPQEQRIELLENADSAWSEGLIGAFVSEGSQWLALSFDRLMLSDRMTHAST